MIKKIFRSTLLFTFSLVTANYIWHNLIFQKDATTILMVALILTFFELILKPILSLLLLPITIITLGTIRIVINTIGLYLAVFLIAEFSITNIDLSSFIWQGFTIPNLHFEGIIAYIVTSISISLCYNIFSIILKRKANK